jgi:AcrR family transcriptional regulator
MKEGSGMNFIRARGEEQKKIRIQQIVDAAASLYAEVGYDKVTFSQIGRKLSFSRLNLYNYFRCKEDIFLTLLLQDIRCMVEDAEHTFSGKVTDRDAFCLAWAELNLRHQRMLSLFSITNTVILKDASTEMHRRFRMEMRQATNKLKALVQELFPEFSPEQASLFVECESSYALTLYPASLEYKNRMHIEIFRDADWGTRDFISQDVTFLKVLLNGLEK